MYRRGGRTRRNNLRRPAPRRSPPPAAAANRLTDSNSHGDDDSVIIIEDDDVDCTPIDLTSDDFSPRNRNHEEVIDLTSPISQDFNLPVVIGQPTLPRRSPRNRPTTARIVSSDSDSDGLPDLNHSDNQGIPDFDLSIVTPEKPRVEDAPSPSPASPPQESPTSQMFTCPVCLDNYKEIRASKRQMYSTVCGHVFCNECIKAAIQSHHKCPMCRMKLTLSMAHPIFLEQCEKRLQRW